MGVKISKHFSYKLHPNVLKLLLNFPSIGRHKTTYGSFETLSFRFLANFVGENFEFIIVAYGETKSSIIWKMSDRGAKRSEI